MVSVLVGFRCTENCQFAPATSQQTITMSGSYGYGNIRDQEDAYSLASRLVKKIEEINFQEKLMIIDPVCDMKFTEKADVAQSIYKGKTYYFCSVLCKQMFDSDPEKYIKSKEPISGTTGHDLVE